MSRHAVVTMLLVLAAATSSARADACFDAIQDKVPWDREGKLTRWSPSNIAKLCAGAEDSVAPARCFADAMQEDKARQWPEAIRLCAGKRDEPDRATSQPQAAEVGPPAPPAAARTRTPPKAERPSGGDRSVFGIVLGEALRLPMCPIMAQALGAVAETCRGVEDIPLPFGNQPSSGVERVPGVERVTVVLSRDRCPDWVIECKVSVVTQHGHPVAMSFKTLHANSRSSLLGKLTKKYGEPDPADPADTTRCQFDAGDGVQVRTWTSPDLFVRYRAHGLADCLHGSVEISTDAYQALHRRNEANQPQM
jgi:hypothetical protein